jgi:ABC-type uncharacterized transport system involved in gliding motility auxiliary subunit
MKRPGRRTLLVALPLLAIAFVALVALSGLWLRGARVDLTENHLYTLSPGTLRIIDRVPEPITLELFYSEKAAQSQPQFRVFAQRVRELLEEVAARSKGRINLRVTDPEPFSDAEDRAANHGLQGVPLGESGDKLYFGLVGTNSTDGESSMPFIQPAKEAFLEYDVAKMVAQLSTEGKPVLAVLSSLPMGPGIDPLSGQPTPGWVMDRQLSEFFDIRRLQANPTSIGKDVNLLMVVHPKLLPPETEYAIDQFVLRGGHLLVFVDPEAESDASGSVFAPNPGASTSRSSTLPTLFAAWGLAFDPGKVVLDVQNAMRFQPDPSQAPVRHLAIIGLRSASMNQRDVVTADLETVNLSSAGTIALGAKATASLEPLLQSSSATMLTDPATVRAAQADPGELADAFKADGQGPYVLAGRLTGVLKSAFPEHGGPGHLGASTRPANIIVVADTDLLTDKLWVQSQDFLGQQILNPFANNADFVYNAVDNLIGNDDLIEVRTRPTANRPFERVDVVRRRAEVRYQAKEKQLQDQLANLEQKLATLQPVTATGQAQALSREQQAQLLQFQQQKLRTRKDLRNVQHQLNAEIEAIGTRIKLLNILAMPLLVLMAALFLAWRQRSLRRDASR